MNRHSTLKRTLLLTVFFLLIRCVHVSSAFAQAGGPPMLTDDPGTPELGHWEINTSINSEINHVHTFEAPLIDINYGYKDNVQLKFEMPYILTKAANAAASGMVGTPLFGVKFRFMDEDSQFVSISTYPQFGIPIHTGDQSSFKLPIEFEKTLGHFVLGEEIGYTHDNYGVREYFAGTVIGLKLSNTFEIMGEVYVETGTAPIQTDETMINFGLRYNLSEKLILIASFGKDVQNRQPEDKNSFFSYSGLQWLF
jgi:hypothetical protein